MPIHFARPNPPAALFARRFAITKTRKEPGDAGLTRSAQRLHRRSRSSICNTNIERRRQILREGDASPPVNPMI
jgi:hypothetical protein